MRVSERRKGIQDGTSDYCCKFPHVVKLSDTVMDLDSSK
jgi:hypothetical protein